MVAAGAAWTVFLGAWLRIHLIELVSIDSNVRRSLEDSIMTVRSNSP